MKSGVRKTACTFINVSLTIFIYITVADREWQSLLERCKILIHAYSVLDSWTRPPTPRVKREVKWTPKSTVRPTFVPPGNKLGNVLILNGTNWCGTGNKATSFDDLGNFSLPYL